MIQVTNELINEHIRMCIHDTTEPHDVPEHEKKWDINN